jgi:hypothetical protein
MNAWADQVQRGLNVLKVKPATPITPCKNASVFDSTLAAVTNVTCDVQCAKPASAYLFRKQANGPYLLAFWDCSGHPENENPTTPAQFTLTGVTFDEPVWVDTVTGAIYELPQDRCVSAGGKTVLKDIPLYDAPAFITDRRTVVY